MSVIFTQRSLLGYLDSPINSCPCSVVNNLIHPPPEHPKNRSSSGRRVLMINWWHSGPASCLEACVSLCGHCLENNSRRKWKVESSQKTTSLSPQCQNKVMWTERQTHGSQTNVSVQQPAELQSAQPPGDEWFICWGGSMQAANGAGCTATEGGRRRGRTDRKLEQMETLTSSYFVMCGQQARQLDVFVWVCVCVWTLGQQTDLLRAFLL